MNNDLEHFSEESLKELIEHINKMPDANGNAQFAALSRIALAAKQAKPVAWIVGNATLYNPDTVEAYAKRSGLTVCPLYTTPPANSPAIPDGWKLVPIEPTEDMVKVGCRLASEHNTKGLWSQMIAAAPKPESE